jgi:hypothetical protein
MSRERSSRSRRAIFVSAASLAARVASARLRAAPRARAACVSSALRTPSSLIRAKLARSPGPPGRPSETDLGARSGAHRRLPRRPSPGLRTALPHQTAPHSAAHRGSRIRGGGRRLCGASRPNTQRPGRIRRRARWTSASAIGVRALPLFPKTLSHSPHTLLEIERRGVTERVPRTVVVHHAHVAHVVELGHWKGGHPKAPEWSENGAR